MKWLAFAALAGLAALTTTPAKAQKVETVPIGTFAAVDDKAPSLWAVSGYEIFQLKSSANGDSPFTRTQKCDARTVEIFARTVAPPLQPSDFKAVGDKVVIRRYLLLQVTPADARAEGMSPTALAQKWATSARKLYQVAPLPSRLGI